MFTNGLTGPFDLVAEGGPDNVWIVEVGDTSTWNSFDEFADAVTSTDPQVRDLGTGPEGVPLGFEVAYTSPTGGDLGFSSEGPFTVDGTEVPLHEPVRYDNPFGRTEAGDTTVSITDGGHTLRLDFDRWTRDAGAG